MPAFPPLDDAALRRLRDLVRTLHRENGHPSLPHRDILRLADEARLPAGVTVDLAASAELGQPMIVLRMRDGDAGVASNAAFVAQLSPRERDIVALIADGLSNKQIARRLHIALATVKDHVHRILDKTGKPNRAALAAAFHGGPPADAT